MLSLLLLLLLLLLRVIKIKTRKKGRMVAERDWEEDDCYQTVFEVFAETTWSAARVADDLGPVRYLRQPCCIRNFSKTIACSVRLISLMFIARAVTPCIFPLSTCAHTRV